MVGLLKLFLASVRTISFGKIWLDCYQNYMSLGKRRQFLWESLLNMAAVVLLGCFTGTVLCALQSLTWDCAQTHTLHLDVCISSRNTCCWSTQQGNNPPGFSWPMVTRVERPAFLNPRHLLIDTTTFSVLSLCICEMWFASRSKSKPLQGVWWFRFQPISNANFFNKVEISRCTQTAENHQRW